MRKKLEAAQGQARLCYNKIKSGYMRSALGCKAWLGL